MEQINVYFDTEFTGLCKNAELLSIGLLTDNDIEMFYAEFPNSDKTQMNEWVIENILPQLFIDGIVTWHFADEPKDKPNVIFKPTHIDIRQSLLSWFKAISCNGQKQIKLISDVCHYDMVFLIDMLGGTENFPEYISPACHDINQDIETYFRITSKEAFDKTREDICCAEPSNSKHNALYDAGIIKKCYKILQNPPDKIFHDIMTKRSAKLFSERRAADARKTDCPDNEGK